MARRGVPESEPFRNAILDLELLDEQDILVDPNRPLNGRDNAVNSIGLIRAQAPQGLGMVSVDRLVTVTHATQTRRLGATFAYQAGQLGLEIADLSHCASNYPFSSDNPYDQYEVAFEVSRILELSKEEPSKTLERPADIDEIDIEYAASVKTYHERNFAQRGIKNPSTADGTDRSRSPLSTIVRFTEQGKPSIIEIPRNILRLWPQIRGELAARRAVRRS